MNDFTTLLIASGRMEDRLREAERARLAKDAARRAPGRGSLWALLRRFRRPRPVGAAESGTARPRTTASTVARPC